MILAVAALATVGLLGFTLVQTRRIEQRFPPAGKFVDADGVRLHAIQRAPDGAERATVLLIHGASGNQADMMLPLGDMLASRGFRVIAVDRPGHGWSQRLAEDHASPAAQAEAIRAGVEKLGIERAIVIGHSWAGSVVVNMLIDHADFCVGAVLLAPVTHPWPGGVRLYYKIAAAPFVGWLFAHLILMPIGLALMGPSISGVFAPSPEPPDYANRIGAPLALRPEVFRANARDVVDLRAFLEKQAPRMGGIDRPVAILSGDHDGVVLTECHSFGSARDIPGATLTMMTNVGHSPHWADPSLVADEIEMVFARVQSAREMRPEISSSAPATSSQ